MEFLIALLAVINVYAQPQPQPNPKPPGKSKLELDADVIEGEKRLPSIFFAFETHAPNLDSVIYTRQDFNDFVDGGFDMPLKYQASRDE